MHKELSGYTAIIGIDWADKKHDMCVQAVGSEKREFSNICHQVEGVDEWAAQTINKSYWPGLYYYQQRAKGCSYQAAVRSLAFKWIHTLYRCWVTQTPYDEAKYLKALRERGSPLLSAKSA